MGSSVPLYPEPQADLAQIDRYFRAANFLSAAQIYLKQNALLREPLQPEHIKDRLLGHWGTCPGINLVWAHLNRLIQTHDLDLFLIVGPGHGAPAVLANLYLEGSLEPFYPELTQDVRGAEAFVKRFSWPGGFPSHVYPGIPGAIHEGGELGYALGVAFGAVLDNPDLIVACIVGDGEAETGPTAAAWHSTKFLDPAESGAVLPILHLNGYKISNPTILGTMEDQELVQLFSGYGYQVRIVQGPDLHADLSDALEWAYGEIRAIQMRARTNQQKAPARFPLLILRTLKGWTGIKEIAGERIEGNCLSHQVPAKDLKSNPLSLQLVAQWLESYHPRELFDEQGKPMQEILDLCPKQEKRMGVNAHTFGGNCLQELQRPEICDFATAASSSASNVQQLGKYLKEVILRNPKNFRLFSPDELESNLLGSILEVTNRDYQWPIHTYDRHISSHGGRVLEILSEHVCQAWLQGYLLTGRHALFPSYEAFLPISSTMMGQFAKFLKFCRETSWRRPIASLNYLETSTLWRQEHNGFSHQNPMFINILLNMKANIVRIYLPPDANCLISTMDHCLQSKGYVNLVVANKQPLPQWLSMEDAISHCRAGASVWKWASTQEGVDPDVVLVGIGDTAHLEVMAAAHTLRAELPQLRIRVVNVTDLLILEKESSHPHGLDDEMFEALFTKDRPVIINFHGYPSAIKQLLYGRNVSSRMFINGYLEEGTTTTPFDMAVRNRVSRFHVIMQAIRLACARNAEIAACANERISHYEYVLASHREFIQKYGKDPDEITQWPNPGRESRFE